MITDKDRAILRELCATVAVPPVEAARAGVSVDFLESVKAMARIVSELLDESKE